MKKIFLLLLMCFEAFSQGGPNGPPNPACFSPNPPPWCDNPPVPIDDWQLILVAFLIGIMIGYSSLNTTFNTKKIGANR